MRRKNRVQPLLLAGLLLSGCGAGTEPNAAPLEASASPSPAESASAETVESQTAGLPEPIPVEPFTVPAETAEGQRPEKNWKLPTREVELYEAEGQEISLLAQTEDGAAAFYALAEEDSLLLRWDGSLAQFRWSYRTPRCISPQLWRTDADGDGEDELAVNCYAGSGTGVSVWELHIVEQSADGTLTGYTLPSAAWETLSPLIRVERNGGRWYAMLDRDLVDITDKLPEDTEPEGLRCGDYIHFAPADGAVTVMADAWLDGEDLPPTLCYAADVQAEITCRDGAFTVQAFHLNALEN